MVCIKAIEVVKFEVYSFIGSVVNQNNNKKTAALLPSLLI